jgi:hypothetical protein
MDRRLLLMRLKFYLKAMIINSSRLIMSKPNGKVKMIYKNSVYIIVVLLNYRVMLNIIRLDFRIL